MNGDRATGNETQVGNILANHYYEGDLWFEVTITSASSGGKDVAVTSPTAVVRIIDDDAPPVDRRPRAEVQHTAASRNHVFRPAYGGGYRTLLLVTTASPSAQSNSCTLDLRGSGLDATRFEAHPALRTAEGEGGRVLNLNLGGADSSVTLTISGGASLAQDFARLRCAEPVTARLLSLR